MDVIHEARHGAGKRHLVRWSPWARRLIKPSAIVFEMDDFRTPDAIAPRQPNRARTSIQIDKDLDVNHREEILLAA